MFALGISWSIFLKVVACFPVNLNFTFAGMVFGNTVEKFTFLDDAYIA